MNPLTTLDDRPTLGWLVERLRAETPSQADVASAVGEALSETEPNPRLVRVDLTGTCVSYLVALGPALPLLVGGQREDVQGGLLVGSSVGRALLQASLTLTRASCGNTVPTGAVTILRHGGRGLDLARLRVRLAAVVRDAPERLREGVRVLEEADRHPVADADREVRALLRRARLPAALMGDVLAAYAREPNQSRFGVAQAVAWAAQRVEPETQWTMERAAAAYLARGD